MFFIDSLTGDIHTKQTFDYESQNRYCLIIQAKDKGDLLATITVQVDIEFSNSYSNSSLPNRRGSNLDFL